MLTKKHSRSGSNPYSGYAFRNEVLNVTLSSRSVTETVRPCRRRAPSVHRRQILRLQQTNHADVSGKKSGKPAPTRRSQTPRFIYVPYYIYSPLASSSNDYDSLLPQRFTFPPTGKAHSGGINGWIACKKGINLCLHIILRGNDVKEVFDDTEVEITPLPKSMPRRG